MPVDLVVIPTPNEILDDLFSSWVFELAFGSSLEPGVLGPLRQPSQLQASEWQGESGALPEIRTPTISEKDTAMMSRILAAVFQQGKYTREISTIFNRR